MTRVGVVLSGCGFQDGSEIQEAVFTLLYLDREEVEIVCMAPNINQTFVVNHLTGEKIQETRNVLLESSRICRGEIQEIKDVDPNTLDAVIIPGGFGAALNLSTFATDGVNTKVNSDVENLILTLYDLKKPLGFICIAPTIAAKVFGNRNVKVTIGTDSGVAEKIGELGAKHEACTVDDIVVDLENKVVSTPAYMLGPSPKGVAKGIKKLVREIVRLAKAS